MANLYLTIVLAPLLGAVIAATDWRTAWIFAAVAVWLVVVPIARFGIVNRPAVSCLPSTTSVELIAREDTVVGISGCQIVPKLLNLGQILVVVLHVQTQLSIQ